MTSEIKINPHTYTIELRISGNQLNPEEITKKLNLKPNKTSNNPRPLLNKKNKQPFWSYNGSDKQGFQGEWVDLEEGLQFIIEALNFQKINIIDLSKKHEIVWWCGHFQSSFDGGPTFSAKLLSELSSFGIPLSIDNYFSEEDDENPVDDKESK